MLGKHFASFAKVCRTRQYNINLKSKERGWYKPSESVFILSTGDLDADLMYYNFKTVGL
jgi:hypothetical protein